jgi:maltose/moltooligosaccharide transporter
MLFLSMAGVGVAWASILSMPYVILSMAVPAQRMGVYMGVFNMFIVIPQIVMSFTVPNIFNNLLGGDARNVVVLGGVSLLVAAVSVMVVQDVHGGVSTRDVLDADAHELLTVQGTAQPVPSTGLIDETPPRAGEE